MISGKKAAKEPYLRRVPSVRVRKLWTEWLDDPSAGQTARPESGWVFLVTKFKAVAVAEVDVVVAWVRLRHRSRRSWPMIFAIQCRLWTKRFSLKFRRDKFLVDTSFIDVFASVLPVFQPSSKPKTKTVSPSDFSIDENWLIHWMNWHFSWSSRNSYDSIVVKGSKNVDFEQIFLKGLTDFEALSAITPSKFQVHLIEVRKVITDSKAIKMPDFWKSVWPPRIRKSKIESKFTFCQSGMSNICQHVRLSLWSTFNPIDIPDQRTNAPTKTKLASIESWEWTWK